MTDNRDSEHARLQDLEDAGGRLSGRKRDDRFSTLGEKRAVYFSADQRWHVTLTDRGRELLDRISPDRTPDHAVGATSAAEAQSPEP